MDSKTKKKVKLVNELAEQCAAWVNYVKTLGNECAYSDRYYEDIVELAKRLADEDGR